MSFNRIDSVNGDSIEIRLRQLGASKIQKVQGSLYFIKFILDDDFEVINENLLVSFHEWKKEWRIKKK